MEKKREKIGISNEYSFTHKDSLVFTGPKQWYYYDYKTKDSINLTNKLTNVWVWLGCTEVTNRQYNYFLNSLLKDSMLAGYELYKPKHEGWTNVNSVNPFYISLKETYSTDKYLDYPVVNISKEAMMAFTVWLNNNEPNKNVFYKLPSIEEWIYGFNPYNKDSVYSWYNEFQSNKNAILGNFAELDQEQWRYEQRTNEVWFEGLDSNGYQIKIDGPQEVHSNYYNDFGIYNMSGNVAEVVYLANDTSDQYVWTKGGSWRSPPYYGRKHVWERYILPSPCVGFRVVKYEMLKPKQ